MITGNKGEWSEIYVLLRLLAYGRLYAADDNLEKIESIYSPIIKIIREEIKGQIVEYKISSDEVIEIYLNNEKIKEISRDEFENESDNLFKEIIEANSTTFGISRTEDFMKKIKCNKLEASSNDKIDITMKLHDVQTGFNPIYGFSIKSELGSAPTLLNASKATNFQYEIEVITDQQMESINALDNPRSKIIDRMEQIFSLGTVKFSKVNNENFSSNLMLIDSRMEELMAEVILCYYQHNINNCIDIIDFLEDNNPLGFPKKGFYEFKFKKFLCSVALGMKPSVEWDGLDKANGGYIVVSSVGDVLAYHIYNRDYFEKYLLKNTKLERASTSRHDFAKLYKEDNKMYINLNLQIRFK